MKLSIICALVAIAGLSLVRLWSKAGRQAPAAPSSARAAVELVAEPDAPKSFGRKMFWIAVRAPSAEVVASTLGLVDLLPANWASGVAAAYTWPSDCIFVTPPIDGWVLAAGGAIPDPSDPESLPNWRSLMVKTSTRFGDAQYFGSHRVSSFTAWGRYANGTEKRLFVYFDGDPLYNIGEPYPEELPFTSNLFDPSSPESSQDDYWERTDLRSPDEDDPLLLAGHWSVNPDELEGRELHKGRGLVGRMVPLA